MHVSPAAISFDVTSCPQRPRFLSDPITMRSVYSSGMSQWCHDRCGAADKPSVKVAISHQPKEKVGRGRFRQALFRLGAHHDHAFANTPLGEIMNTDTTKGYIQSSALFREVPVFPLFYLRPHRASLCRPLPSHARASSFVVVRAL